MHCSDLFVQGLPANALLSTVPTWPISNVEDIIGKHPIFLLLWLHSFAFSKFWKIGNFPNLFSNFWKNIFPIFEFFGKIIFQKLENNLETIQFSKFWKKQMNDACEDLNKKSTAAFMRTFISYFSLALLFSPPCVHNVAIIKSSLESYFQTNYWGHLCVVREIVMVFDA